VARESVISILVNQSESYSTPVQSMSQPIVQSLNSKPLTRQPIKQ